MSFLLFIGGLYMLGMMYDKLTAKSDDTPVNRSFKSDVSSYHKPRDFEYVSPKKSEETIVNNYYIQQNVYVQHNNHYGKSSKELSDHSAKAWKELGYSVKYGESYSYKFYGKEIFTPQQVEKSSSNRVKYSEDGLASKLLNDTGSKKFAKDILVREYDYSESNAKNLVGYRGY